jgi:hypothetical protein
MIMATFGRSFKGLTEGGIGATFGGIAATFGGIDATTCEDGKSFSGKIS